MSTQQALLFLRELRANETLRAELRARQDNAHLSDIVAMGVSYGFVFDIRSLQQAFAQDWAFRMLREQRRSADSRISC